MNNKEIADSIRNKKFSELTILDDPIQIEQNEDYYGFRYFLLDAKDIDTSTVFNEILGKHGSPSKAYEYLGIIAREIHPNIGDEYFSASYFQRAIEHDENNANAWWELYHLTNSSSAFFKSLKLDYEEENFESVSKKLNDIYLPYISPDHHHIDDWAFFIKITKDDRVSINNNGKQVMALAHYYLDEFECGIDIINSLEKLNLTILSKYYFAKKIDQKTVISKISIHEKSRFLSQDYNKIYQEYMFESKRDEKAITKSSLIEKAFKAKHYSDVIDIYNNSPDHTPTFLYNLQSKTFFTISKFLLRENVDKTILQEIKDHSDLVDIENPGLYKIFLLSRNLNELEQYLYDERHKNIHLEYTPLYKKINKLLNDSELINHYLYDELYQRTNQLEQEYDKKQGADRLTNLLEKEKSEIFANNEFIEICSLELKNNNFDAVINRVNEFHDKNTPTIITCNMLGVCMERQEKYSDAFPHYRKALELMKMHSEYHYVILGNYLKCANKISLEIPIIEFKELKTRLNISLTSIFKWNWSISGRDRVIYKYYPLNINTIDALVNQYFYFPSKDHLNDPIELPTLEGIGQEQLIDSNYRICSFTNNNNSMLMWSHYTQNHEGIMVEYKFGHELPEGVDVSKVEYTNEHKRNKEQNEYLFNQYLLTKNGDWSYEKEIRLISYKKDKVYFERFNYPQRDRSKINAEIRSVTLGCKFPEEKINLVMNIISTINEKKGEHESNIKIRKARISNDNPFKLEYFDIDL